ncbi:hypothetical protein Patl1_30298 [Pistacia atlantica]|uniref:Uncharacterized protein n=1 Tax=Pistacia atlantica TaxID=434234 RepID=A0ACC1AEQ3_9ROSI|nr:hypothetical protein Patl1_30298 [Pistacia atlantica]
MWSRSLSGMIKYIAKGDINSRELWRRWMSSEPKKRFAALWGNGDYGRLGLGSLESQWRPVPVVCCDFENQCVKAIACGGAHTFFLTVIVFLTSIT